MPELDQSQIKREKHADGEQAIDQDVTPENGVQEVDRCAHAVFVSNAG